ncbi:3D domain-containing protein [Anaerohalosphaera lusitana]|uniref:3D domain-containing protein n=1 Tax=Anaerohalosphaera lusitana TaxID=1936003 RepID=UPI0011BA9011|nr:3D domain-containing protein [Anaerohalosphaera lusitana]
MNIYSVTAAGLLGLVAVLVFSVFGAQASPGDSEIVMLSNTVEPGLPTGLSQIEESAVPTIFDELGSVTQDTLKEEAAPRSSSAISDKQSEWVTVRMRVTAYCPCAKCCGKHANGITANGHKINWGDRFVASDKMFGFGTEMKIPGYNGGKSIKVKDRGRLIKGNRLDVFYNTHYTAKKWGTRYLDVKVRVN